MTTDTTTLLETLKRAQQFIRNGVELGYIRMPDADTPDPAHDTLRIIDAAIASNATEPTAQSEREAFEKAMNAKRFFPAELNFTRTKSPSGRDEYANSHLQSSWEGWQARAALAKPTGDAAGEPVETKRSFP